MKLVCPTANPHLKGKGKGNNKGFQGWGGGKGWQTKGKGKGKGGKGKGKGGMFTIDLWGSSASDSGSDWFGSGWNELSEWGALRSLSVLSEKMPDSSSQRVLLSSEGLAPIGSKTVANFSSSSNRFSAFKEDSEDDDVQPVPDKSMIVPIADLVRTQSKRQEKRHKQYLKVAERKFSECASGGACGSENQVTDEFPALADEHGVAQPAKAESRAAHAEENTSVWGHKGLPDEKSILAVAHRFRPRAGQPRKSQVQPDRQRPRAGLQRFN